MQLRNEPNKDIEKSTYSGVLFFFEIDCWAIMAKFNIIYQSNETIQAREKAFGEWIEYNALITIKDG